VPDLETIDAGPNPDEVSATMAEPEEVAAKAEPEAVDSEEAAAIEPPVAEPEAAADSEPESITAAEPTTTVTAAEPEAAEPAPAPTTQTPAQTPSEVAETPLEEVQAQPPQQQQADARPEPVETVEAPATTAKAQEPPKERPVQKTAKAAPAKSDAPETAAQTTTTGEQQAALPKTKAGDGGEGEADTGSGRADADSAIRRGMANYQFLLQAWLEKHKKYPRRARLRHWQGTAVLRFIIDREGNVLSYRILESSGHEILDEEVEAMIRRATPLPPVPDEMQSARLEFDVPVRFFLK
jgi:protein TonB